ncbi:hypothetical protein C8Q79DRAFT_575372 [Trametes meyenii]|nr:hypothetical protein C8Q79DRAFT_575372 [Trametes meyenii]
MPKDDRSTLLPRRRHSHAGPCKRVSCAPPPSSFGARTVPCQLHWSVKSMHMRLTQDVVLSVAHHDYPSIAPPPRATFVSPAAQRQHPRSLPLGTVPATQAQVRCRDLSLSVVDWYLVTTERPCEPFLQVTKGDKPDHHPGAPRQAYPSGSFDHEFDRPRGTRLF